MSNYFGDFGCKEDLEREFQIKLNDSVNILFACYFYEYYDGDAYVIFEENGKLYDVRGGHCSCYGLEGQFNPNETTAEALRMYVHSDNWGYTAYSAEALQSMKDVVALL